MEEPQHISENTDSESPNDQVTGKHKPLRIWIPILLLLIMAGVRFVPGLVENGPSMIWMVSAFGPFLASLLIVAWWLFLSRARWYERLAGLAGLLALFSAIIVMLDPSMQGPLVIVMTIPMGIAGFAVGLCACWRVLSFQRTVAGLLLAFVGASYSALLQNYGTRGDFSFDLDWRWNETPEQQFLAERVTDPDSTVTDLNLSSEDFADPAWPGFRGPKRDGVQVGTVVADEWSSAPEEIWRIKVGPAWSSFAVAGRFLVTQEQRGPEDAVVCYLAETGEEVWSSAVESRFFEALGGLGPRATPTVANGKVFAMCAEGSLRCLQAVDGSEIWSRDIGQVADVSAPMWGFSSSPLITDGIVAIHAGGDGDLGVLAFDTESGDLVWSAAAGKQSYSSFQLVQIQDEDYLAILTDKGAQLFDPASGAVELDYEWQHTGYRALQAQLVEGNKLVMPTGMGTGTRLIEIQESDGKLKATELWTSRNMKPDYNDLVVHQGYIYGFDNQIFACISLKDGARQWKRGRYGKGQVLLLADSNLLVIAAENGDLAFLRANPEAHEELARFEALDGKTWNHPVVVGDRLYLRNAQEAVCYRLPIASRDAGSE